MGVATGQEREERGTYGAYTGVTLGSEFASQLPELAVPSQAAAAPHPEIAVVNTALADELGVDLAMLESERGPEFLAEFLTGRALAAGSKPVAQLYSGHQFGSYSPMLGDGRALLLGEIHTLGGRTVDLHLKGSGPTAPARGDGFAALGPMLREYLVSEAMHALGVPTTRALAVVTTGRTVRREDFARDNRLPGAVLARVAASHLRVGSFQLARARGDRDLLARLVDFAIRRHYPALSDGDRTALGLFREVVRAQAHLTAKWMLIGFVHGVMNTDNVTISGETIDYGPCAFIDAYDPAAVFSSIDQGGRYAFGAQPSVAKWNLARFAEALLPLLTDPATQDTDNIDEDRAAALAVELARTELDAFDRHFNRAWSDGMAAKLGLRDVDDEVVRGLAEELFALLAEGRVDYTTAFRRLTDAAVDRGALTAARDALAGETGEGADGASIAGTAGEAGRGARAEAWLRKWVGLDPRAEIMLATNPVTIPRNHLLAAALDSATDGDLAPFNEMLAAVTHPFEARPEWHRFALPPPSDAGRFVTFCGT